MKQTIAFIGLGNMGEPMVKILLKAGSEVLTMGVKAGINAGQQSGS